MEILEGGRTFDIVLGTITGLACLAVAAPILWWSLPAHRRTIFSPAADRRGIVQIAYGVFCMAMAWADALCRYIPHSPLGFVHPAFFVTTAFIVAFIGPRVVAAATRAKPMPAVAPAARSGFGLVAFLVVIALIPIASLAYTFGPAALSPR